MITPGFRHHLAGSNHSGQRPAHVGGADLRNTSGLPLSETFVPINCQHILLHSL